MGRGLILSPDPIVLQDTQTDTGTLTPVLLGPGQDQNVSPPSASARGCLFLYDFSYCKWKWTTPITHSQVLPEQPVAPF